VTRRPVATALARWASTVAQAQWVDLPPWPPWPPCPACPPPPMGSVSVPLTGIVSSLPVPIEAAPPAPVADGEAMLGRCSAATDGLLAGVELDVAAGLGVVVVAGGVLSDFCSHAAVRSRQSDPTVAYDLGECRNMVPPIDDRTTLFGAARRAKFVPCAARTSDGPRTASAAAASRVPS
jgi:hypothetical protein